MPWNELIDELAACRDWNYHAGGPLSTEPAAMTALALIGHGQIAAARPALDWIRELQTSAGSVGVTATQAEPTWATALAIVAWGHYERAQKTISDAAETKSDSYQDAIDSAQSFLLTQKGLPIPENDVMGHDSTLIGWSWAADTHSWIEPTSLHVWALKMTGLQDHDRTREAVRLLVDRQIPGGGCNYGNTFVLDQKLMPHHQPTAICLLTLMGEDETAVTIDGQNRRDMTVGYLARQWPQVVGTSSTCYAAMALAAYDRVPDDLDVRLNELLARRRPTTGTHSLALIALAASRRECPLATMFAEMN